jgi:hypothetical protein
VRSYRRSQATESIFAHVKFLRRSEAALALHLAYELHVTASGGDLQLERVRVFDGGDPLLTYGPEELEDRIMVPERPRSTRYGRLIRRNTTAVISVWFTLPDGIRLPRSLRHELYSSTAAAPVGTVELTTRNGASLVLGPAWPVCV